MNTLKVTQKSQNNCSDPVMMKVLVETWDPFIQANPEEHFRDNQKILEKEKEISWVWK